MSASHTSLVSSVSVSGVAATACITAVGTVVVAGTMIIGAATYAAYRTAKQALSHDTNEEGLMAIADLKSKMPKLQQQARQLVARQNLSAVDAAKVTAMATITTMNYAVNDKALVQQNWQNLQQAKTLSQVNAAQTALQTMLEQQSQQVMIQQLVSSCRNASIKAGFEQVKLDFAQGKTRMIATNFKGEALVTEISNTDKIKISTETVGITDGSCNSILEIFDRALAAEGVKKGDPDKKWTGGICELAASREFIRSRPIRATTPKKTQSLPETDRSLPPKQVSQPKIQQR